MTRQAASISELFTRRYVAWRLGIKGGRVPAANCVCENIEIRQDKGGLTMVRGVNLSDVVKALNSIGATPQDLLAILQAMKAAGALRAELEII